MEFEELVSVVSELPGGPYAVLGAVIAGLVGAVVLCYAVGCGGSKEKQEREKRRSSESDSAAEGEEPSTEGQSKAKQQGRGKGSKSLKQQSSKKVSLPSHSLLATEFKGHTGAVLSLDFDVNGKFLASCSDDRTIRLWHMKTLQDKEHKYTRKNIELDHATRIRFSPDGTAVVVTLAVTNTIMVYRITKAPKGGTVTLVETGVEFPKLSSSSFNVLSLGIAATGKFIMTYSVESFTVWTLKGEELATVPTLQSPNTSAAVSPCGKFVACAGFTSDVKLWEVEFSKSGEFQKVSKAMDLKGHRASVLALSYSGDSHRMATVSKDGTWKYWDIDVQYKLSEDPKLLTTGKVTVQGETCISLAPDSRVVAVAVSMSIFLYSTASGDLLESLEGVHRAAVTDLCWDPCSLYLVSAGGEDRHVRVWHNTPGMKELLVDLKAKLPKATSEPLKRRIQEQMKETRGRLDSIEGNNS